MTDRFQRISKNIPQYYKPGINRNWKGILTALANENDTIDTSISNAKDQLFVQRASAQFLDMLGSNVGVPRTIVISFIDTLFRELIPILSFYPKQVKPSMYAALALFWPADYMHSTITSTSYGPYVFAGGERLFLTVDETKFVDVSFLTSDFENPLAATAQEVVDKINSWLPDDVKAFVTYNNISGHSYVSIATNTYGLSGSVQITGGSANSILNFSTSKSQYTKVSLEEVNANEIVVRIPREINLQNGDPRLAHRFHADSTIVDGRPSVDSGHPFWPGHFFYDFRHGGSIGISSTRAHLSTPITAGDNYSVLTFDDVSQFPSAGGYITFDFGLSTQETVRYLMRLNNTQLRIDPFHTFSYAHASTTLTNLSQITPVVPRIDGYDYAIFFLDTGISRELTEGFLLLLKAA